MTASVQSSFDGDDRFTLITVNSDGSAPGEKIDPTTANARDKWFVIAPAKVRLHPNLREIVLREALGRPDVDLFYGDEVAPATRRDGYDIFLKPELDLAQLVADDYVGFPIIVRASAMGRLGGLRPAAKSAAAYDLVVRAVATGLGVARITEVLAAHNGPRLRPNVDDRRAALRNWLAGSMPWGQVDDGLVPGTLALKRRFAAFPDVTLVVPTRQSRQTGSPHSISGRPFIIDFLNSIADSDFPMDKLRVLVGDDVEDDRIYFGQRWPFEFRRIVTARREGEEFNYAAKMNRLWRAAETEHIVLMNDDLIVESPSWLRALLTFSMQESVGGVGARLLYPNNTIQHAGMPGGLFDLCAHAWLGQHVSAPTYQNWALVQREWSIVTGAVFATRKDVMETVNGFDERFSLEFNDADLCLRMRMLGYRIVYTPFAEFIHHEKASRGEVLPLGSELALFLKRWGEFLERDPAYHPQLARNTFDVRPLERVGEWWQ